jgi:hypothetical protein
MKRVLGLVMVGMMTFGVTAPAYADRGGRDGRDRGGDSYDQREGCGEQGGGCHNRRDEDYSGAGCKYVCPKFDKSPVHDAFNFAPFICMPGATCYQKDPDKKDDKKQPSDGNQDQ